MVEKAGTCSLTPTNLPSDSSSSAPNTRRRSSLVQRPGPHRSDLLRRPFRDRLVRVAAAGRELGMAAGEMTVATTREWRIIFFPWRALFTFMALGTPFDRGRPGTVCRQDPHAVRHGRRLRHLARRDCRCGRSRLGSREPAATRRRGYTASCRFGLTWTCTVHAHRMNSD